MAFRKEDWLTSIFELLLLELLPTSPQPLTTALQPPASPVLNLQVATLLVPSKLRSAARSITHASLALLSEELNLPAARLN